MQCTLTTRILFVKKSSICSSRDPKYICFHASFSKNMHKNGMAYMHYWPKHITFCDVYVCDWWRLLLPTVCQAD